jgi:cysteine synthase B
MICALKGYRLRVVMPENVTRERVEMLRMYGAEIHHSPGGEGSNGAVAMALAMADADRSCYMPYQYGNPANPGAHYHGTAVEILEELGELAAFVGGLGTGGTLMGCARRFKEEDPDTLVVAAEPLQGELVQGLRSLEDGYIPPILDLSLLDRKILVANRDAVIWTRRLLEEEGLFVGVSSGAVASVAVRVAKKLDEGNNVVFVAPDDGWRYLSSGVYSKPLDELERELESMVLW